jgi:hypothetical protein
MAAVDLAVSQRLHPGARLPEGQIFQYSDGLLAHEDF